MSYAIGITTFKRREELLYRLVSQIRQHSDRPISIMVNADYKEPLDASYVKRVMSFCCTFDNVIPTFFPTFTSLSKMWNTIIVNSSAESNLILNDDLVIYGDMLKELPEESDLLIINGSWSHFMISRRMAIKLNFFDERLLAFGEEDGDMTWKYQNIIGGPIPVLPSTLVQNIGEGYRDNSSKLKLLDIDGFVFRPTFNRQFLFSKMYAPGGTHCSMFGSPHQRIVEDLKQYPYEQFKVDNYDHL